jgi:glycopeptide antibiotics resistance protein
MESIKHQSISRLTFWLWLGYAGFVIYGSLMPFQFQSLPFGDAWALYLTGHQAGDPSFSWHDFVTNIALFLPIGFLGAGVWLFSPHRGDRTIAIMSIFASGCLLSAGIEFLQLYFPPRVSWGYDLLGNSLGTLLGYWVWRWNEHRISVLLAKYFVAQGVPLNFSWPRCLGFALVVAYVLVLTFANNWYDEGWLGWQEAMIRLPSINFLPFYYHQEASTWIALISVLWHFALYIPIGAGLSVRMQGKTRPIVIGAVGAIVATIIEAGKLFVVAKHPDSGNVVIATLAAIVGFVGLPVCIRLVKIDPTAKVSIDVPQGNSSLPIGVGTLFSLGSMLVILGVASRFPVMPLLLTSFLVAYAIALRRWHHAWLWVLPAALPVLDLAPYSGWFFLDEFDLLVLVTLAVAIGNGAFGNMQGVRRGTGYWLAFVFGVSTVISLVIGLWPFPPIDQNAFSHYFSHYNALRVAKGAAWGLLLSRLLVVTGDSERLVVQRLSAGIVIGLAGAATLAVWERAIYPGLWNFDSQFRIGAFFSSMHNGGSHIEAYFVMAMPFVLVNLYYEKKRCLRVLLAALFLVSGYVLMVTFARGGYAAFAVALLIVAAAIWRATMLEKRRKAAFALGGVIFISLLSALPVLSGSFAQQRLGATSTDLGVRQAHWDESLRLIKPDFISSMFGMGMGRFPETYYFGNREGRLPAMFSYGQETGNKFLTLGTGDPVYVEQVVDISAGQRYQLSLDTRNRQGPDTLNVLLCERTYFYSYGCVSTTLTHQAASGIWEHHNAELFSGELGAWSWLGRRAVKLSLENAGAGTMIDVDNVILRNEQGANLVANGDFEVGHSNWFFSSTFNHLPWHIKNLWIGLLFDQGWFGMLAFAGLILVACFTLARSAWKSGGLYAGASLASVAGFLCVGLFDSLFDAPRLITLFFLILVLPGTLCPRRKADTAVHTQDLARFQKAARRVHREPSSSLVEEQKTVEILPDSRAEYMPWLGFLSSSFILQMVGGVLALSAAIAAVTHLPFIPYNLRDLPNPYHPLLAPVILAVFLYWVMAIPALAARWLNASTLACFIFPGWVMLHGVIAWALVRNAVLPVMIHKVAGSPVLDWSGEWETLIRFGVLEGTFFMLQTGGTVIAATITGRSKPQALVAWVLWAICLLPISHYVIVTNAATDNLVELMAGGGSVESSLLIAVWIVGIGMAGGLLSSWVASRGAGGWRQLLPVLISIPVGYLVISAGLEPSLQKFDQVFSGLQFLLSMDRTHYASGWNLWLRYSALHCALLGTAAFVQYPFWLKERK